MSALTLDVAATAYNNVLNREFGDLDAAALISKAVKTWFPERVALVSSFGTESAVLLHLLSRVSPTTPVIFIDTGKVFGETKRYRDTLIAGLGLKDVRSITPESSDLSAEDPDGMLFSTDPDRCCYLRKVLPLERALDGFDAWFTGRKRYQGGSRDDLPIFEFQDGRIKINPLASWDRDRLTDYLDLHDLPRHPLEDDGFLSVGCMPCTERVSDPDDVRSGRWAGSGKTECGIHTPIPAKVT